MNKWIKLILPAMVLGMAVLSPAPIIDQQHGQGTARVDTEQDLQNQQRFNGTVGVRGNVVEDTTPNEVGRSSSNPNGRSVFNAAENQQDQANAEKTMREAQRTISEKPTPTWIWGLLVGAIGFGSIMGVRVWANRTIQTPVKPNKVRW